MTFETRALFLSILLGLLTFIIVPASIDHDSKVCAAGLPPCGWEKEEEFVIPGTVSDSEQKVLDKLLDALEKAIGGGIPEINAVKTAIDKLGPGKDVVDVVVMYKCVDSAGKIHRRRAILDGQTEAVFWAAKMNLVSGAAKATRDRERQKAINNHKPKVSCCTAAPGPGANPPVTPTPTPRPPTPPPPTPRPTPTPCKPAPPCPECKEFYDKIASSCDDIKEIDDELLNRINPQLKPREDEVQTATGERLKTLKRELAELNRDKKELTDKKNVLQTDIANNTARMKTCEKANCGKTATGKPAAGTMDACMVGNWVSQTTTDASGAVGYSGIKMTIMPDGGATLVYTGMEPAKLTNPVTGQSDSTKTWNGTASGKIAAKNGVVILQKVDSSALEFVHTVYGRTDRKPSPMLGIVFPPAPYSVKYQCDERSLKVSVNFFGDIVDGFIFTKK